MPVIWNSHVFPPGGFYFDDADGIRHSGPDIASVARKLKEYRIQNGKPPGNPVEEIVESLCRRYPTGCRGVPKTRVFEADHPQTQEGESFKILKWLSEVARAIGKTAASFVTQAEADRRAEICRGCPKQAKWQSSCGGCAQSARRLSFSIRKGKEAAAGALLQACGVLHEDTRTSVFLDNLKPAESVQLPDNCWRKKAP